MKHVLSLRNTISLILAITVLASVAILPVSAKSVTQAASTGITDISSINMQTGKAQYNFPCTIDLNGNWKRVREAKGFTTDQQLLDDINTTGIQAHNTPGAVDLNDNTSNRGPNTYGICEGRSIYTAIGGTVLKNPTVADENGPTYFGWYVQIDNMYGQKTYYGHMSARSDLVVGKYYPAGTYIGTMGCTGNTNCTPPSGIVHFDAWVGTRTDNWEFVLPSSGPGDPHPEVVSSVRNDGSPTEALTVNYFVTFSESVFDVDVNDFVLTKTGTISGESITSVNLTTEMQTSYMVTVNTGTGDGELRLDVPSSATITDLSGQSLNNIPFTSGESYTINKLPPIVVSIVPANPNPTNTASVVYTVTFSKPMTGVDTGDFTLTKTGTISGESITNVIGSSPNIYTVNVNTGAGDGNLRLDIPSGATITDLGGKPLANLPYTSGVSYTIDKTPPTVISSVRVHPNPNKLSIVDFTVTFSESVTGVDITDFAIAKTGTINSEYVIGFSGGPSVYIVSVNSGAGDGSLGLYLSADVTVTDIAGNLLAGLPYTGGESYMIDKTPPTAEINLVNPNPSNLASVDFAITFSESVTNVDVNDFVITTTGTISGATITGISVDPTNYKITVNTGSGDGDLCLGVSTMITDLAGNPTSAIPKCYMVDKTTPIVVSIVRVNPSPTNLSSVDFTVNFSEPVTGVEATDFVLNTIGALNGVALMSISGGPITYIINVKTGTGDGELRLDVSGSASVTDLAENALVGSYTSGESYLIDRSAPTVESIIPENGNFIVTFHESVTGVDILDFVLIQTGAINDASITGVSGGPSIYTVGINTGTGSGDLRLGIASNPTIADLVGNWLIDSHQSSPITFGKLALRSTGSGDGWMLESNENSNEGRSKNSSDDTFRLGDDSQNRQYRSILYFPTNYLPYNAVVTKGILTIKKQSIVGRDPFTTHGNISLDIRKGPFGKFDIFSLPSFSFWSLLPSDFEAPADLYSAGSIVNNPANDWYWIMLDSNALNYINHIGVTQVRLGFQLDDNNNLSNDYIKFYSGDAVQQGDRPHLQLQYYVP